MTKFSEAKGKFSRQSTGLLRQVGPITGILFIVTYTIGLGWQTRTFQFTGTAPLPENMWIAGIPPPVMSLLLAGLVVLVSLLAFSILTAAMPRSGGGYVAISRLVSPLGGFIAAAFVFISLSFTAGILATIIPVAAFFGGPELGIMLDEVNDVGLFVGGVAVVILVLALGALRMKTNGYVMQALFWIPAVLTVCIFYLLGTSIVNPASLESGVSSWAQSQGFSGVSADTYVKAALEQGLDEASIGNYWVAVSNSMLGAYWAYIGFAASTFVAGEIEEPGKNLPRILLVGGIIVIALYVTMASLAAYAASSVGQTTLPNGDRWSFFEAYSFLSFGPGDMGQAGVPPFGLRVHILSAMSAMGLGLGSLNILIFLFSMLWIINESPAMILLPSRVLFAMAFDRVLPERLAAVNERFGSPVNATAAVGVFAVMGCLAESGVVSTGGSLSPGGMVGDILNSFFSNAVFATTFLEVTFFSLFALALVLLPYRNPTIFNAAPFKPGGKTGVAAIGVAALTANLVLAWLTLTSPFDSYNILAPTPDNLVALGYTALLALIACLIYGYYRWGPPKKKIDYEAIFSEIPPE